VAAVHPTQSTSRREALPVAEEPAVAPEAGRPPRTAFAREGFPVRIGPVGFLAIALVSESVGAFGLFAVAVLDVYLAGRFHLSLTGMGITVAATSLGVAFGLASAGPLSDRWGPRRVLAAGTVAAAGCAALLGALGTFHLFVALLVPYGAALASIPASGMKAVFAAFAGRPRGLPMGIRQGGTPVGAALAALVLPVAASAMGLATLFRLVALVLLAAGGAFVWVIPAGLAIPAVRLEAGGSHPESPAQRGLLRAIAWPLAIAFLLSAGQYDIAAFTLPDLGTRMGLTAAGAVLAAAQVGCGVGRVGFGLWSDRTGGNRPRVIWRVTLLGVVAAVVAAAGPPLGATGWAAVWFVFGLGAMGWNSLGTLWAAEAVDPGRAGAAMSAVATVVMAGATLHPPLFGAVAGAGGFRDAWAMLALDLAIACTLCSLAARPARPRGSLRTALARD